MTARDEPIQPFDSANVGLPGREPRVSVGRLRHARRPRHLDAEDRALILASIIGDQAVRRLSRPGASGVA